MSYKLYFVTDKTVFENFILLTLSLKELFDDTMILFNDEGMKIHRETEQYFVLSASWDKQNISNDYYCPNAIKIQLSISNLYDNLINLNKNPNANYFIWFIPEDQDDVLEIHLSETKPTTIPNMQIP